MKIGVKFLVPFLLISTLSFAGCNKDKNKDKDEHVLLSFGDVHSSGTKQITVQELNEHYLNKESFLLVVSTNTCGCWSDFEPNLTVYLTEHKAICYRIDYNQIKDVANGYGLLYLSSGTTTFAIYEQGQLKTSINSNEHKNIMSDKNTFYKYMEETVRLSSCYFITKEDYHEIKDSGKNAVIYFARSKCGDCNALDPGILYSYIKSHKEMNNIYVLDCQDYWAAEQRDPSKEGYEEFKTYLTTKSELGMSEEGNPDYGFGEGVFPFFSYIENKNYASGCVIYNQRVGEDLKINNSYYTTERVAKLDYTSTVLEGLQLSEEDVSINAKGRASWIREKADQTYEKILTSFLDWSLPKSNFSF